MSYLMYNHVTTHTLSKLYDINLSHILSLSSLME